MRYASLNGGKRVRAMLVYASGQSLGAALPTLDIPACSIELIHAYSLVHDDLPAMDDDTLRRGKPSCHIAYDEATAILVGDALHSLAFELLAETPLPALEANTRLVMIGRLAMAAGTAGMVGGQAKDIAAQGQLADLEQLKELHLGKTGALIRAAVAMGAMCGSAVRSDTLQVLDEYAGQIGLAFQIVDDILDEESDTQTLGKNSGSDRALDKATFPSIIGLEASKGMVQELHAGALSSLDKLDTDTHVLKEIARMVVDRRN